MRCGVLVRGTARTARPDRRRTNAPPRSRINAPRPSLRGARSATRQPCLWFARGVSAGRKGKVLTSLTLLRTTAVVVANGVLLRRGSMRHGAARTARPERRRTNAPPRRCEERAARRGNLAFGLPGRTGWLERHLPGAQQPERQGPHVADAPQDDGVLLLRTAY